MKEKIILKSVDAEEYRESRGKICYKKEGE